MFVRNACANEACGVLNAGTTVTMTAECVNTTDGSKLPGFDPKNMTGAWVVGSGECNEVMVLCYISLTPL